MRNTHTALSVQEAQNTLTPYEINTLFLWIAREIKWKVNWGVDNLLSMSSQKSVEMQLAWLFNLDEEHVNALWRDYEMTA